MVMLEEEDRKELVELYKEAQNTPVLYFAPGRDTASSAWERVREKMNKLGVKYGFNPEAMKGIDPKTGEIKI